ncbi:TetR family transcriptional regulator [Actinobaculum suis]|uniref:TetR family transcriptional regulator n=1 Tax=Actinobaculum suis TaxID=1657 RepID=A0A7Z8Y8G4_9ACTO|nr:TetR/AcrR family transcriptional regulator [Actinobaculum suis]VDG75838.1 TetR family transcriptional regulator [Actinobaculum suis]
MSRIESTSDNQGKSAPNRPYKRVRMTRNERRVQLAQVARDLFARKGYDAVSIEEIAAQAGVSKPVVYEHFGGKEGIYNVVVDRELTTLSELIFSKMYKDARARETLEAIVVAVFEYIETNEAGFRLLVQRSPSTLEGDSFSTVLADIADIVSELIAPMLEASGIDPRTAPIYGQMLAGGIGQVGQWWVDEKVPDKENLAAHVVNFVWDGLRGLETEPKLRGSTPIPHHPAP